MASVCCYFQVHQPYRLKKYSFFEIGKEHDYFDDERNETIMQKVAERCYLPANRLMLSLIERYRGDFRIAFSISGVAIEQMKHYAPEALEIFKELAATGCVEFLAETYHHSLSSMFDEVEFKQQVALHRALIQDEFDCIPRVFRNTELIYDDRIGRFAADLGFDAVLAEGVDDILKWRSPNFVYQVSETQTKLLLKNYRLSDDIAFRFSNPHWHGFPLTSEKYAGWLHALEGGGETINLFMDYETFGEHQWASTGIFDFMEHLPDQVLSNSGWSFKTPSETIASYSPASELSFDRLTSWADLDRGVTAWNGNRMQRSTLEEMFALGHAVQSQQIGLEYGSALDIWRKLQSSDHYYYMGTKGAGDGDVHAYFSPYESPYDAFINFQNVLRDFRAHYMRERSPKVKVGARRGVVSDRGVAQGMR